MVLGDGLVTLATLFAAGYVVLSARIATDFPPVILAQGQQTVGFLFALAVLAASQFTGLPGFDWNIDLSDLAYAAFSDVIQYAIPFWLYLIGLRVLRVGKRDRISP